MSAEYRRWKANQDLDIMKENESEESQSQQALIDKYEEDALDGIKEFLHSENPYEFQDMVAALLRAMGYFILLISLQEAATGVLISLLMFFYIKNFTFK